MLVLGGGAGAGKPSPAPPPHPPTPPPPHGPNTLRTRLTLLGTPPTYFCMCMGMHLLYHLLTHLRCSLYPLYPLYPDLTLN